MMEQWKAVNAMYEASSLGRVRSIDRTIAKVDGRACRLVGKLLAQQPSGVHGYLTVMLGAGSRRLYVHRLVAEAFCEKTDDRYEVNHKNGNILDNRAENLEWVSRSQNISHSFHVLGRVSPMKGRYGEDNPSSKKVVRIDPNTGERCTYGSCADAARDGFDLSEVAKRCRGVGKTHKGYQWEYC